MFTEEAAWIRWRLEQLDLPGDGRVADIGSSTLYARAVGQPHVEREVLRPLRARGLSILHVDAVEDPGVDVTVDLTDPALDLPELLGGDFDVVLCLSLLAFVTEVGPAVRSVARCVAPGGYLVATTQQQYRVTRNPLDNGWRPRPEELFEAFAAHADLEPVALDLLRIHDNDEYLPFTSRMGTTYPLFGRDRQVPGGFDQLRRLGDDSRRWAQSCVLARRPG